MTKLMQFEDSLLTVTNATLPAFAFRHLSKEERGDFIKWAREQPQGVFVDPLWHPVIQDELLISGRGREKNEGRT